MSRWVWLFVLVLFFKLSYSQKGSEKSLIEYVQRDSESIIANIIIPSFETKENNDEPQIIIETKNTPWLELHYARRNVIKNGLLLDTCFIATYDEKRLEGIDPTYLESACVKNDEYCAFVITSLGDYVIRFRVGAKTKSYKLKVI